MVFNTLQRPEVQAIKGRRVVRFDCDNCGGQNKNRWVVWFCSFLVLVGLCDEAHLHFLVAGHTKNAADGAFGLFKRAVKRTDVITPQDANRVLSTCSDSVVCVPCYNVRWVSWKKLLEVVYDGKVKRISKMHNFAFLKDKGDGVVVTQETSSSLMTTETRLLKEGADVASFKARWREMMLEDEFQMPVPSLDALPQSGHGSRREYLVKEVVDRLYRDVPGFTGRYFGNGAGWEEAPGQEVAATQRPTPHLPVGDDACTLMTE